MAQHSSGWTLYEISFLTSWGTRKVHQVEQFHPSATVAAERFAEMWERNEGARPVVLSVRMLTGALEPEFSDADPGL